MVNEDPTIYQRKEEHIRLAIENDGYSSGDIWLDRVNVVHEPFPQLNFSDIDLQTSFLGKTISAPILIDALTGGTSTSYTINKNLAEFAAQKSLPICVGSQRIMLKPDSHLESFRIVRKSNPDGIVLGNIGISQILQMESFTPISEILDVIEADGLCVHLNVLQELIQQQEPLNFKDGLAKISQLSDYLQIPIIFKEVGVGMSREFAERLIKQGFDCFNIAGFGGTNFTRIEARRNQDRDSKMATKIGNTFSSWGIPTAASILEVRSVLPKTGLLIASGGIRSGRDIGISISLGADLCGLALPFLKAANKGSSALEELGEQLNSELKIFMMLTGVQKLSDLAGIPKVYLPPLSDWIVQRKIQIKNI